MKKTNILLGLTAAIALAAASSLPASATGCNPGETFIPNQFGGGECVANPQPVPEPSAILGTLLVGAFIGKKAFDARKVKK
jgi:hypothetical protein